MQSNSKVYTLILVITILCLLLGFGIGYVIFNRPQGVTPSFSDKNSPQAEKMAPKNPIFSSQTAYFQGYITKVEGRKATLKSLSNFTATYDLAENININQFNQNRQASASSDIKKLLLNTQMTAALQLKGADYQIVSVTYLPETAAKK